MLGSASGPIRNGHPEQSGQVIVDTLDVQRYKNCDRKTSVAKQRSHRVDTDRKAFLETSSG